MMTTFLSQWQLTSSPLSLGVSPALALAVMSQHGANEEESSIPWCMHGAGASVVLEVGPVDVRDEVLRTALGLFHRLRDALAAQLPGAAVVKLETGARLVLPTDALTHDTLGAMVGRGAAVLGPWVHHADAQALELRLGRTPGTVELRLQRVPVPETFDALVLAAGALVRLLARDVVWDGVRPEEATGSVEHGPEWHVVHGAPLGPATARLWRHAGAALQAFVPRREFDAVVRWLELPADDAPPVSGRVEAAPALPRGAQGTSIRILPFRSGGRPIDELEEPGTGTSEPCAFVRSGQGSSTSDDELWLLYRLDGLGDVAPERLSVRASAWFLPHDGETGVPVPVPRMQHVPVDPWAVGSYGPEGVEAAAVTFDPKRRESLVARFFPQRQFFPCGGDDGWSWSEAPAALRARVPDGDDPYTLGCLFHQRVLLELSVCVDGKPVGCAAQEVKVYDLDRFGSLYGRLLDLVARDTAKQAAKLGRPDIYPAHHPWYPVLGIGMNKANFYMKAIIEDARRQTRHLGNPWWLLDVGLYLELLTCIGVFETVRDEFPDLLTASERRLLLESPRFREIRARINPQRWKGVWALREILPRGVTFSAGPVSFLNLMRKQTGTLEFLHAHHEDLVHAVELAGPDLVSSQQAWHRVYRDAERAVTNSSLAAFPELSHVPASYREFALWHEKGDFSRLPGGGLLPSAITGPLGDQDGVYPSAARQYRESMNHVATVCRDKGLMDYAGDECVPVEASLIESTLKHDEELFRALQARDGYGGSLTATSRTVEVRHLPGRRSIVELLRVIPLLEGLEPAEIEFLADHARVVQCVPTQVVVRQGDPAGPMYVVEGGRMKVEVTTDGVTRAVRTLVPGEVVGETSLLTGAARTATVSALDYAALVELSRDALEPLVRGRAAILDGMSELLVSRQAELTKLALFDGPATRRNLGRRMREHLVGEVAESRTGPTPDEIESLLAGIPLFALLTATERADLARRATTRTVAGEELLMKQGDRGRSLFAVQAGTVSVHRKENGTRRQLAALGPGALFGELGLLTGERRSADVQATPGTTVVEISRSDFLPLMTHRPPIVVELSDLLEKRRASAGTPVEPGGFAKRIHGFFFA